MTIVTAYYDAERWLRSLLRDGIDMTERAHIKLTEEAAEFAKDKNLEEAADVFVCLVGALMAMGHDQAALAAAVKEKLAVNATRTWVKDANGTFSHS